MQLIIQNFGPIKQGQINLTKKFYVFVGQTILAKLMCLNYYGVFLMNRLLENFLNFFLAIQKLIWIK
jgi:hypothetical protein